MSDKHDISGDELTREHLQADEAQCDECTSWITVFVDKEGDLGLDPECHFCDGNIVCDGHLKYLHGTLDQHGRERTEQVDCKKIAQIYDKEGNGFYCVECWTNMCDGNPMEYEEFIHRRTA